VTNNKALCFSCLYRDTRPETGTGFELIYCTKKEMVVRPKIACPIYGKETERSKEEMRNSMYGTFDEEEEG
jgi:hypothetical protein